MAEYLPKSRQTIRLTYACWAVVARYSLARILGATNSIVPSSNIVDGITSLRAVHMSDYSNMATGDSRHAGNDWCGQVGASQLHLAAPLWACAGKNCGARSRVGVGTNISHYP